MQSTSPSWCSRIVLVLALSIVQPGFVHAAGLLDVLRGDSGGGISGQTQREVKHEETLRLLYGRTGLTFPSCSRVMFETDGAPRDGTTGYRYWAIFLEKPIILPGKVRLPLEDTTHLADSMTGIEKMIWPYKINQPRSASLHSWRHHEFDVRVTAVTGKHGVYLSVETFARQKF